MDFGGDAGNAAPPGGATIDLGALMAVDDHAEEEDPFNPVEVLMPFLKQYNLISRSTLAKEVNFNDLKALAKRWNIKYRNAAKKDPSFDTLLNMLINHAEYEMSQVPEHHRLNRTVAFESTPRGTHMSVSASADSILLNKARDTAPKLMVKNYFGLPDYAYDTNPEALVYQARKNLPSREKGGGDDNDHEHHHHSALTSDPSAATGKKKLSASAVAAQKKVSDALLTMVGNDSMAPYFIHQGGVEAIMKLLVESDDQNVLTTCIRCLLKATETAEFCKVLNDKHILSNIQGLLDKAEDQDILLGIAQTITNLSYQPEIGEALVLGGIVSIVQGLFVGAAKFEIYCYCMCTMNNVSPALASNQPDAELCLKILMSCTKKLEIARHYENACFAIDIFVNFSRMLNYGTLLCEEGVLPLFIHTLEAYMTLDMMGKVCEGILNLSMVSKNRREISTSGIAGHLDKVFTMGTSEMRAHILSMIGNLLSSGFFHDKIARDDAIKPMLSTMFDPEQVTQFTAVSFVLSQLAQVETSSKVMVRCGVITRVLDTINHVPKSAKSYLWILLTALSQQPQFFEDMVSEKALIKEMYLEVFEKDRSQLALVVQLMYNLSMRPDLCEFLEVEYQHMYTESLKAIFEEAENPLKVTAISTLINFTLRAKQSRAKLLGTDLVEMFEDVGTDNPVMNVKYAAILNIISNEENLCIKLLDSGAQKFLVGIQSSINALPTSSTALATATSSASGSGIRTSMGITGDLGRALTAATFHNLALKRAILGPGVLSTIMTLLKNNKSLRVYHCVRTLARISVHPKAKNYLTKERHLIPLLTATMRSGCAEADRVQHYCALVICNTLASVIPKDIMEDLCGNNAITDLVVCTLLRINSVYTKESMGKALFNLMARADFRFEMVVKKDVLTAMLELAKIENHELLELCIRSVYNITCEYREYNEKMRDLKVANILIARTNHSNLIPGAKATTAVKMLCGMAMANISFDKMLAEELVFDRKVSDAAAEIFKLSSDEATYCSAVIMMNLSLLEDSKNLADSKAIPLLVDIIERGPITCIQMAVATLCNFSKLSVFYDQLTALSIPSIVGVLSAPTMHEKIKTDALQFLYNLTVKHSESWKPFVQAEGTAALWKVLKSQGSTADGNESKLYRIGRIVKEVVGAIDQDEDILKKLLADGVMSIILKLAKIELPDLKFDLSCAIYTLSFGPDPLKVLQWDSCDILFWLTVHDCLNRMDPILQNVSRAIRNFSASGSNGVGSISLAKEERAITVLRALAAADSEDVQWQCAGTIYNMLQYEESQDNLTDRGVVGLLLDLAAKNFTSVRHVCSACLHMCKPEAMPDLSDPAALSLVLCLLEVDGEKFGELSEFALDQIPYILGDLIRGSDYLPEDPPFKASWVSIACEVDAVFTPALIEFPSGTYKEVPPQQPGAGSLTPGISFNHLNGGEFFFGGGEQVGAPEALDLDLLGAHSGDAWEEAMIDQDPATEGVDLEGSDNYSVPDNINGAGRFCPPCLLLPPYILS